MYNVIKSDDLIFPFGLCIDNKCHIFVSDFHPHCRYQVMIEMEELMTVVGRTNERGEDDGPTGCLDSQVRIASRGEVIYIAEHPLELQGSIRIFHTLEGLIHFQGIWNKIADVFGMISKREMRQQPFEENENRKVRALSTVLAELDKHLQQLEAIDY